jgi:phenylpropionate dioxygenase-like ring-hydroxylating dioxygenase large terminal subunit
MTKFLKDCWYAAAWTEEVEHNRPLVRTIAGVSVLVLKSQDGTVHALENRCPHRFAPLDRGQFAADRIRCGYHGLVFNFDGACVENPQGPVLQSIHVTRYVAQTAHGVIWTWLGDPERADIARIPNLDFLDTFDPRSFLRGYTHVQAYYELLNDNIMDLSHVDVLHRETLSQGSFSSIPPKSWVDGEKVRVRWDMFEVTPSALNSFYLGQASLIDAATEIVWQAPANMRLTMTMRASAKAGTEALVSEACHLITPESTDTSHYFYCAARNFGADDSKLTAARKELARKAFDEEDKPMIEAIHRAMGGKTDLLALRPALLAGDAGAVRVRRALRAMIDAEYGRDRVP